MARLKELIYDQMQLVKYMNEATTREERGFYRESINEVETLIENARRELNLK